MSSQGTYLEILNNCTVHYRSAFYFIFFFLLSQTGQTLSSGGLIGICSVNNKTPFLVSCLNGTFIALHSVDHVLINDCPLVLYGRL